MTTINQLSTSDTLTAGDLLPIWRVNNSDTRKTSLAALTNYLNTAIDQTPSAWEDVPSNTITDLSLSDSSNQRVTGTTTILNFGNAAAGTARTLRFASTLTLTHNAASMILPGVANITTAENDTAEFISLGSGNWICTYYVRANGFLPGGTNAHAMAKLTSGVLTLENYAALTALTAPASNVTYEVLGRLTGGDGGGGQFLWNGALTTTPDGGIYFQPDAGGTGRWVRVYDGDIESLWFSRGDDVEDIVNLRKFFVACRNLRGRISSGALHRVSGTITLDPAYNYFIDGGGTDPNGVLTSGIRQVATDASSTIYIDNSSSPTDNFVRFENWGISGNENSGHGVEALTVARLFTKNFQVSGCGKDGIRSRDCYSAQHERPILVQNGEWGLNVLEQGNHVGVTHGIINGNSRKSGFGNINWSGAIGQENRAGAIRDTDYTGAGQNSFASPGSPVAVAYGLVVAHTFGLSVEDNYSELGVTYAVYAGPTARRIAFNRNYVQDGVAYFDGLIDGEVTDNTVANVIGTTSGITVIANPSGGDVLAERNGIAETAGTIAITLSGTHTSLGYGALVGMTLSNNVSDATNDIDFAAGKCTDSTNVMLILCGALTKRLDANWVVGTNQGGLDTGSIANTTYHCFAIRKNSDGSGDFLFSTSATAPTMPTGYTYFRRIGSIVRTGGAIKAFTQTGDYFQWTVQAQDIAANITADTATLRVLTVPAGISVLADIHCQFYDDSPAGDSFILISSPSQTDSAASIGLNTMICSIGADSASAPLDILTDTSRQIRTRTLNATVDHYLYGNTRGYTDTRGRIT